MRLIVLFALLTFVFADTIAQSARLDSLYENLRSVRNDTSRITLLLDISREYDLDQDEGYQLALEAYKLSQSVDSEKLKARSEVALGLFKLEMGEDSAMIFINRAIDRYDKLGLTKKISDVNWNLSIFFRNKNDNDSAVHFLEQSLTQAEERGYTTGMADASFALAGIHHKRGNNTLALKHCFAAKDIYEKEGMTKERGEVLNQIGIIYDNMGLYSEALENYLIAKEIAKNTEDAEGELLIINNLGVMYDNMNNTEMALKYYTEALEKAGIFDFEEDKAFLLNNLSYIYLKNGDTIRAKSSLWESLEISERLDMSCFDIYPLEGLGSLYLSENNQDSAAYYLNEAFTNATICEDIAILTTVNLGLGKLYEQQGQYRKSLESIELSLRQSREAQLSRDEKKALYELTQFYKRRGNKTATIKYLELYQQFSDSLYESNNIEKASQFTAEFEFRKQVEELEKEQLAAEIAYAQELKSRERENQFILLALILLALLATTLGRSYYFIQKQNKKLKWLNEEKNTLMGVVAHDLRNPLNMIRSLMQLITGVKTSSGDEANSDQYMHLFRMSTQKMSDMIEKVLDISAIENMKINLNMTKVNINDMLKGTTRNFKQIAENKGIEIKTLFKENTGHFSNLDASYFDQVLDNLVSNAIKFSSSGTCIYLDVRQEGNYQIISVKDEGPGLNEEEKQALFKRFATFTAKPTSNEKSTGLGLSIVKKFVTAMDGEISVESELGKGTTFNIKFKAI
ncbi:MAG: tetratricopeptide repeat-containing sensor histidine kinase [Cyclobacteriaceae bacterium]